MLRYTMVNKWQGASFYCLNVQDFFFVLLAKYTTKGKPQKRPFIGGPATKVLPQPPQHFLDFIFLELQKRYFFLVARPLPPTPEVNYP